MKHLLMQLHEIMKDSLNSKSLTSSTRFQSYIILLPILGMILVTTGIEITSFSLAMYHAKTYVLSNEFVLMFGMILAHHLSILFSRSKNPSIAEISKSITTDTKGITTEEISVSTEDNKEAN